MIEPAVEQGSLHKLGVIQNSIFGVDIQPIAVEISKLRFFLSLIVDEKLEDTKSNRGVESLPNLEFKFVAANTLIHAPEEYSEEEREFGLEYPFFTEFGEFTKDDFSESDPGKKAELREKWVIYVAFIERAYKLLKPNGISTLIVSGAFTMNDLAQDTKDALHLKPFAEGKHLLQREST